MKRTKAILTLAIVLCVVALARGDNSGLRITTADGSVFDARNGYCFTDAIAFGAHSGLWAYTAKGIGRFIQLDNYVTSGQATSALWSDYAGVGTSKLEVTATDGGTTISLIAGTITLSGTVDVTTGCTGTPTAATDGIVTSCSAPDPELSPAALLDRIHDLEARLAALESRLPR